MVGCRSNFRLSGNWNGGQCKSFPIPRLIPCQRSAAAKTPARLERLANDLPKLKKWIERVARDGDIRACYEASGAGYVLHRAMKDWGYACDVIAPSLIPKRSGVQRKHDKRDASRAAMAIVISLPWQRCRCCAPELTQVCIRSCTR